MKIIRKIKFFLNIIIKISSKLHRYVYNFSQTCHQKSKKTIYKIVQFCRTPVQIEWTITGYWKFSWFILKDEDKRQIQREASRKMSLSILFARNAKSMRLLQSFAWLQSFSTKNRKKEHVRQLVKRESLASRNFPLAEDQQCQWLFQTTMRWRKILFAEKSRRLVQYRMAIRESSTNNCYTCTESLSWNWFLLTRLLFS